jgi:hypothetical protein
MTGRRWRCNSGRIANIATRTCRQPPRKRASALTSAHSVWTAPRTNSAMSARTAAVVSSRGRSGRRKSGGLDYRLQSDRRRTSGCTCHTVSTISPRIALVSGTFRPRIAELLPIVIARSESDEAIQSCFPYSGLLRGACHRARIRAARWLAMTEKGRSMSTTAYSDRTVFPVPSSNRRSRPAASESWPRAR